MKLQEEVENKLVLPARKRGVSKENLPFVSLPPASSSLSNPDVYGTTAILLVHGFCATPWEMRIIGQFFAESGYCSLGIILAGHGTAPEDLLRVDRSDWIHSIEEGYQILADRFDKVYAVGLSTGALLLIKSLQLINVSAIALLSPYLRFLHPLAKHSCWLHYVFPFQKRDLAEHESEHYYLRRPLKGICELNRLIAEVETLLPHVQVPTISFSAEGDQTVDWRSGEELFEMIGSPKKEFHLLGVEVPHVLTREDNPKFSEMCNQIVSFFQSVELEG